MKKLFVVQPMEGRPFKSISEKRLLAVDDLLKHNQGESYKIIDNFFASYETDKTRTDAGCVALKYLAKALHYMADADVVYFCKGWQQDAWCRVERTAALEYKLHIVDEETEE